MSYTDYVNKKMFSLEQLAQIKEGYEDDLSEEEIAVYAIPTLHAPQMFRIKECLLDAVPISIILNMIDHNLNDGQICQIRWAEAEGIPAKYLKQFISLELLSEKMDALRQAYREHMPNEYFEKLISANFNIYQISQIRLASQKGLPPDAMAALIDVKLNADAMNALIALVEVNSSFPIDMLKSVNTINIPDAALSIRINLNKANELSKYRDLNLSEKEIFNILYSSQGNDEHNTINECNIDELNL